MASEELNAKHRAYYAANKERLNRRRNELRALDPERFKEYDRARYQRDKDKRKAQSAAAHKAARLNAVEAMGGSCSRCGTDDIRVLEIDHVDGGGSTKARKSYSDRLMFRQLARGDYEGPRLQLLCGNCHNIKTYWE